MQLFSRSRTAAVVAGAAVIALAAGSGAVASSLVTSKDIQDDTIKSVDIHNGAIQSQDLSAALRGRAGSPFVRVKGLDGAWQARDTDTAGVKMTGDGVKFGPFVNGGGCATPGVDFGRLDFSGMNGKPLRSLKNLVYYARYTADDNTGGVGSPTMRVFFAGTGTGGDGQADEPNRLTFSPNTQTPDGDFAEGPFHEWVVTQGSVRYNDDGDNAPAQEKSWASFMSQFGNKKISNINILNGCEAGQNLTSLVRWVQVNGKTYTFGR